MIAVTAMADRIVTVYGNGGKVLLKTAAANLDSITYGGSKNLFKIFNARRMQLLLKSRSAVDSLVFSGEFDKSSYPEINVEGTMNQMTAAYDDDSKVYTLETTGYDPYIFTKKLSATLPDDSCVLAFEYNCPKGVNNMQIFFADPVAEGRSVSNIKIPATIGTEWATFRMSLKKFRNLYNWGKNGDYMRLDFGETPNVKITLRHLRIRTMSDAEKREELRADSLEKAKYTMAKNLETYLDTQYASKLTNVEVTKDSVKITGTCSGEGSFSIADIAPYEDVTEARHFEVLIPVNAGDFSVVLPRRAMRSKIKFDRALSKWAIVKTGGDSEEVVSHARYADDVYATYSAPAGTLKGKKGIAAGGSSLYISDFGNLDVHSITQNIVLSSIISTKQSNAYGSQISYGNRKYYINMGAVTAQDNILKAAAKKGIIVEAILLTPSESEFRDPECTGGYYTMPNMTTPEAVNFYAAALDYLAKRYSKGNFGRIHHWIMHNEVDMGDTWTNMGTQPEMRFYDRYIKSMRMCYNIVRQYDQHASVLGSYTHSWNVKGTDYSPRKMLEQNVQYSETEGDFRWGVAYHPYPIDLTAPEFWKNDRYEATFTNNSTYVTFYNPEVINAWILDKKHYYKDGTKRVLFFSEQGTNSPSYSDKDLALQAAGAAWIWKKLKKLDGIDAMQWHNWADNRAEFGLRIGMRAYADGKFKDLDPKPVWYVWQAADTEDEDKVFEPYLKTIGITSWDNIVKTVK